MSRERFGPDPDHVRAGLEALDGFITPRTHWLIEHHMDAQQAIDGTLGARNAVEKSYLSECLQSATWLTRSLDQRTRTILKVATEIVRQQDSFLMHGVQYLRPLNLKTVADAIKMHESTVSRVTSNKYMQTPRGTFELKYFFTSAINSAYPAWPGFAPASRRGPVHVAATSHEPAIRRGADAGHPASCRRRARCGRRYRRAG